MRSSPPSTLALARLTLATSALLVVLPGALPGRAQESIAPATVALAVTGRAEPAPVPPAAPSSAAGRNLEVLPQDISEAELQSVMAKLNRALGVQCGYCHVPDDMASDENPEKVANRMRLRQLKAWNDAHPGRKRLTCHKCHSGKLIPDYPERTGGFGRFRQLMELSDARDLADLLNHMASHVPLSPPLSRPDAAEPRR